MQGFAGAAISVVAMAIVRDLFEGVAVARIMSRLMLVIGLAPILAPTIGGLVLRFTSWRGIFVVLAGAALLLVVVALLRPPRDAARRAPAAGDACAGTLAAYRALLARPGRSSRWRSIGGLDDGGDVRLRLRAPRSCCRTASGWTPARSGWCSALNAAGLTLTSQLNPVLLRWFTVRAGARPARSVGAMVAAAALLVVGLTGFGGLAGVLVPLARAGLARPAWRCRTPPRWR